MTVTVYATTWCGYCRRLLAGLDEAEIPVEIIDVDRRAEYDDRIRAAAGGNRVVPTVEIEGRLFVNPTVDEVRAALAQ